MLSGPIESRRLVLRRPVLADAVDIYQNYASNPRVTRYLSWPVHRSVADARAFLRGLTAALDRGEQLAWVICQREPRWLCGMIGVILRPPAAYLGYCLAEQVWGRGYAAEATELVMPHVWSRPDVERLSAYCHTGHVRSARVLEKSGLRYVGIDRTHIVLPALGPHGQDMLHYELARPRGLPTAERQPCDA